MTTTTNLDDLQRVRTRLEWLEWFLERSVKIPVLNKRIGGDALVGLIPGVGDAVTAGLALFIVYQAARAGAPVPMLAKMLARVGADTAIGAIPFVGDAWDFFYASSSRNLADLKAHLDQQGVSRTPLNGGPIIEGEVLRVR
jgi:hypothetical protein